MTQVSPPLLDARAASLWPFVVQRVFGPAEVHAAGVLVRGATDVGGLVDSVRWSRCGHLCTVTSAPTSRGSTSSSRRNSRRRRVPTRVRPGSPSLPWPPLQEWLDALRASPVVRVVDRTTTRPCWTTRRSC
jgi:hypothetical protein